MYIGELIKKYREKHGLSMQDFANLSGISKAYIGVLEKVYNPTTKEPVAPSLPKIQAIASAMGMELDDLLKLLDHNQPVIVNTNRPAQHLNEDEKQLLDDYRKLNDTGKIVARGSIETLAKQDQFTNKVKDDEAI
ncbi:helix-turn-helix transcriptional regulator [uncultured Megasphaera sp.]|uniref:helix-turn-helix domain-containing protein n=1 Tax=uncultured Megasphaera sp. TaxID=165188 RepID=UPI002868803D|nr:helix-turn-helix transcriptional regulator [uncultured Megasphaera sp.]